MSPEQKSFERSLQEIHNLELELANAKDRHDRYETLAREIRSALVREHKEQGVPVSVAEDYARSESRYRNLVAKRLKAGRKVNMLSAELSGRMRSWETWRSREASHREMIKARIWTK